MRYSDEHKDKTRQDLIRVAARKMRAKGPAGVSIAQLMASLGLTHGGFYAHFQSKDALIAAAIEAMFADVARRRSSMLGDLPPGQAMSVFIDQYLSGEHRDRPDHGCPIAALIGMTDQLPPIARTAFDQGYSRLVQLVAGLIDEDTTHDRQALATSIVSEIVGGLTLSRAISDPDCADQLLSQTRNSVRMRIGIADLTQEIA